MRHDGKLKYIPYSQSMNQMLFTGYIFALENDINNQKNIYWLIRLHFPWLIDIGELSSLFNLTRSYIIAAQSLQLALYEIEFPYNFKSNIDYVPYQS